MTRSERPYRRRKAALVDGRMLGYTVHGRNKRRWDDLAEHLEISPSELFDIMVENLPLDGYGRPTWYPEPPNADGVLPIDAA